MIISQESINKLKFVAIILAVVGLGLLIINQSFGLYYKAELLAKPCELCTKLNPNMTMCPKLINEIKNFNIPLN